MRNLILLSCCFALGLAGHFESAAQPADAMAYQNRAASLLLNQEYERAIIELQKAAQLHKQNAQWQYYFACLNEITQAYINTGSLERAKSTAKEALWQSIQTLGRNNDEAAKASHKLGQVYEAAERYADAGRCHQMALDIREDLHTRAHPASAQSLLHLSRTSRLQGRHKQAAQYAEEAIRIFSSYYSPTHLETGQAYLALGLAWHEQGDEAALPLFEKAIATFRKAGEAGALPLAKALYQKAQLSASPDLALAEEAGELFATLNATSLPDAQAVFLLLAEHCLNSGEPGKARQWAAKAAYNKGSIPEAAARLQLQANFLLGDFEQACQLYPWLNHTSDSLSRQLLNKAAAATGKPLMFAGIDQPAAPESRGLAEQAEYYAHEAARAPAGSFEALSAHLLAGKYFASLSLQDRNMLRNLSTAEHHFSKGIATALQWLQYPVQPDQRHWLKRELPGLLQAAFAAMALQRQQTQRTESEEIAAEWMIRGKWIMATLMRQERALPPVAYQWLAGQLQHPGFRASREITEKWGQWQQEHLGQPLPALKTFLESLSANHAWGYGYWSDGKALSVVHFSEPPSLFVHKLSRGEKELSAGQAALLLPGWDTSALQQNIWLLPDQGLWHFPFKQLLADGQNGAATQIGIYTHFSAEDFIAAVRRPKPAKDKSMPCFYYFLPDAQAPRALPTSSARMYTACPEWMASGAAAAQPLTTAGQTAQTIITSPAATDSLLQRLGGQTKKASLLMPFTAPAELLQAWDEGYSQIAYSTAQCPSSQADLALLSEVQSGTPLATALQIVDGHSFSLIGAPGATAPEPVAGQPLIRWILLAIALLIAIGWLVMPRKKRLIRGR